MAAPFKLAPSILAADFTRLGEQVREADVAGADLFHVDVMDGHFVPNISFGPMVVEAIRPVTQKMLDVHLMITDPDKYLDMTAQAGADQIDVHVETCPDLRATLRRIKSMHLKAGVAINPETPFERIQDVLGEVDQVLVMSVHPGFGGQKFIEDVLPKMRQISDALRQNGYSAEIGVDGGVDVSTISRAWAHGGTVLIAGSSIFRAKGGIAAGLETLRAAVR